MHPPHWRVCRIIDRAHTFNHLSSRKCLDIKCKVVYLENINGFVHKPTYCLLQKPDSAHLCECVSGLKAGAAALSFYFSFFFFHGRRFPPTSPCRHRDMINCNSSQISINLSLGLSRSAGACCDRWKSVEVVYGSDRNFGASLQAELRFAPFKPLISFWFYRTARSLQVD